MRVEDALEIAWAARLGARPPADLFDAIGIAQAYEVQAGLLRRYISSGDALAGWKIGGNSPFGRKMFGDDAPFAGFLLASKAFDSGHEFALTEVPGSALIESELCITFRERLSGPDVTAAEVRSAILSVRGAFEVAVSKLGAPVSLAQLCADNAAQWGYVLGDIIPDGHQLDFGAVTAEASVNRDVYEKADARDKVDDQIESIIWLVGHLHRHGQAIEPGQLILSGSCLTPCQLAPGQTWHASFNGSGQVCATFT
jgi:2-keto-4-pentenoate hydratase